jgi:hypothetical protein
MAKKGTPNKVESNSCNSWCIKEIQIDNWQKLHIYAYFKAITNIYKAINIKEQ